MRDVIKHFIPDSMYLKMRFKKALGYSLNLNNPQSYNEKLQWLKLHDRRPEYTTMVDKYAVKKYISDMIGPQYIIPTIGVWDNFGEIDFYNLPNQFVLKCTHDSGGLVICKDKEKLDIPLVKAKIEKSLKYDFYRFGREWPYKNVPKRIIAETYMEDSKEADLRDYKFFCFNGKVKALFIATERDNPEEETKFDFFDRDFNHLDFKNGHPNAKLMPQKPMKFDEMIVLAEKLSQNIPQVRIDFYEIDGKIYFGEITFFHWGGFVPFIPEKWDYIFGSWIELPGI